MGSVKQVAERTSESTTQPSKGTISDQTIEIVEIKCVRCEQKFEQKKLPAGLFRAWLADYCVTCKAAVEAEFKAQEAQRVQEERARAALDRAERQKRQRTEALGGEKAFEKFLFGNYRPELNNTHEWYGHAKSFAVEAKNLFVYGPTGSGKTFLCTAIIRSMWEKGGTCRSLTAQQAANRILYNEFGRNRNGFDQEQAIKELVSVDALFIDELNELDMKDRYITAFKQLVDARANRQKRGLLIAANVDLKTVAMLMGMPLADRLRDQTFDVFRIADDTPSARALLKAQMKTAKNGA